MSSITYCTDWYSTASYISPSTGLWVYGDFYYGGTDCNTVYSDMATIPGYGGYDGFGSASPHRYGGGNGLPPPTIKTIQAGFVKGSSAILAQTVKNDPVLAYSMQNTCCL